MVYLYYANLIGYVRVGCLLVSCFTAFTHPITTVVCYFLSQALDWVDGPIARKYDQCSEYGAILDMVTDRVSDAVFLAILAGLFPNWAWFFFLDIILDIGSHWYQTLSTAMGREESHKTATTEWRLLHIYYHNYTFLSVLIAGNEFFFICLYLEWWRDQLWSSNMLTFLNYIVLAVSFILFMIKKVVSVVQLISAASKVVAMDRKKRALREAKSN